MNRRNVAISKGRVQYQRAFAQGLDQAKQHPQLLEFADQLIADFPNLRGRIESVDYLVLGLMAEHYEFPEIAKDGFQKLEKPEQPISSGYWELAQRRLQALGQPPMN